MEGNPKMEKKLFAALTAVGMLFCIYAVWADNSACPYDDDYKYVLKKALIDYLKDPKNSKLSLGEVKEMLNFYLINPSIIDADCSQGNINALVAKVESQVPDSVVEVLKTRNLDKCYACPDGAVCGEQNAKGQTCTCKDIDNDGKSEFCYLKPIIPPIPTCEVCPDGTLCGEENYKKQTCTCKDTNQDGKYEYCYLKPLTPPVPVNCLKHGYRDCSSTTCCAGLECKVQLMPAVLYKICCSALECADDNVCIPNGEDGGGATCMNGQWVSSTCDYPSEKQYVCPDGTKVAWCHCKDNNKWECINSPESKCGTTTTTTIPLPSCEKCDDGTPCGQKDATYVDCVCLDRDGNGKYDKCHKLDCMHCPDGKPCDCDGMDDSYCSKRLGTEWGCRWLTGTRGNVQCCYPKECGTENMNTCTKDADCGASRKCLDHNGYKCCGIPSATTTTIPAQCITCPDGKPCDCTLSSATDECKNRMGQDWYCGYAGTYTCCVPKTCSATGSIFRECTYDSDCVSKYGTGWTCRPAWSAAKSTSSGYLTCCYPPNMPTTTKPIPTTTTTSATTTTVANTCTGCVDNRYGTLLRNCFESAGFLKYCECKDTNSDGKYEACKIVCNTCTTYGTSINCGASDQFFVGCMCKTVFMGPWYEKCEFVCDKCFDGISSNGTPCGQAGPIKYTQCDCDQMTEFGKYEGGHCKMSCSRCPDGTACNEINAKNQHCDCSTWACGTGHCLCQLEDTCNECEDGTPCGEKTKDNNLCLCQEKFSNGRYLRCIITSPTPPTSWQPTTTKTTTTTTTTIGPQKCNESRESAYVCASKGSAGPYDNCDSCGASLNCPSQCASSTLGFYGICGQGYTCNYDGGYYCSCCCRRYPPT